MLSNPWSACPRSSTTSRGGRCWSGSAARASPIGAEVLLTAGDWLFVGDPQDAVRNAGTDHVVLLIAGLTRVGEPFTTLMPEMEMGATPTP